ncbi:EAL domain-containing protein [Oxalobacteraceae bacterium R-40]|uniref:EAL domain-containing protein n=1 Tax=Keguizhuia sedimenti TaxID=3064264 RepID=A0ABU1BR56_9BURK|nr:EAL domain-containing protein [Oxalobacteraceae bacterium R-40]
MDALLRPDAGRLSRQWILVVSRSADHIAQLEAMLENIHVGIVKAHSAAEAFLQLQNHEVSLVLVDLDSPGQDSYEITHLIHGRRASRALPVIFIGSSETKEANIIRAYRAGAVDFISKPIHSSILQSKIAVMLELEQSRRQLQLAYARLDSTKEYYESILNAAGEGMLGLDGTGAIRFANPAALRMLDCGAEQLIGHNFSVFYPEHESGAMPWKKTPFYSCLAAGGEQRIDETFFRKHDGSRFPVSLSCSSLGEKTEGIVLVFQDITERKKLEAKLSYQAVTDHLTELTNRNGFKASLQTSLERAKRSGKGVAVMFIDLDHFKRINDTLGHETGDHLLQSAAFRLKECVRAYDVISRIGGDEFTVVLGELEDAADAAVIARKILAELGKPFTLKGGTEITIGASIGISTYPECGNDVDVLMQTADVAMYQAKMDGRNLYHFYLPEMNAKAKQRLILEQALRIAVEDDEFNLFYQPQVDLVSGKIVGFEALLRWQHDDIGIVAPSTFVPVLEETGLIVPIGQWVFATSSRHRRKWSQLLPHNCSLSVNLSARQFADRTLVQQIKRVLEQNKLPPHQLEIELTESMLMQDTEYTQSVLRSLKALGLKLAIDDFGTGYSSLAYLKQFSLDTLKIDKQFIDHLTTSEKDAAIATSIIQLAHNLGLQVIAEGVETKEQVLMLRNLGCDMVQGYYFGRPISAWDVAKLPKAMLLH